MTVEGTASVRISWLGECVCVRAVWWMESQQIGRVEGTVSIMSGELADYESAIELSV